MAYRSTCSRLLHLHEFSERTSQISKKTCADGLWRTATDKFNSAQKNNPATRKDLTMIFHLLELISEKNHPEFILAYVVCLHNKVVTLQKKSHKKVYAKLLHLYSPDANAPKLDVQIVEDARQLPRFICAKAYNVSRTDPDIIREMLVRIAPSSSATPPLSKCSVRISSLQNEEELEHFAGGSSLAAKKNVSGSVAQNEVNRRTQKFLTTLASIFFEVNT